MTIRLETSKRTGIANSQGFDISQFERNWSTRIPLDYNLAKPRTGMSALYNCHGLTFASRRTRVIEGDEIQRILSDDKWEAVSDFRAVLPGDIVVYFSDEGDANHSGIVVACEAPLYVPLICSKWGNAGEFIHSVRNCPPIYGPIINYYRCRL